MRQIEYQCAKGKRGKELQGIGPLKRTGYIAFCLAVGFLLLCSNSPAMETTFEVAAGYDDNVAEVTEGEGSGFVQYRAQLDHPVLKDKAGPGLDLFLDAEYSQFFVFENNYRLQAGAELSSAPWHDRFRAGVFAEVTAYRDNLVAEDEHNTLYFGGDFQWLADARLTLSLQQTFSRVDYRNPVSLPGQRIYNVGKGKGKGYGSQNQAVEEEWITLSQKDSIWSTEVMATWAMSPDVQMDLSCLYRDVSSSDDYESYQELSGYSRLSWFLSEFLEVFASGYWSKLNYEVAPGGGERSDDVYGFTIGGSRAMGNLELFVQFDRTVNDSPIAGENYQKSVALCGASYTF